MKRNKDNTEQKPVLGTALAVASGFSFYILCMILPLVGPAGSRVEEAGKNRATFLTVLFITLILSGASCYVALKRRREEGEPFPKFSTGLLAVCLCVLVIVLFNGFAI